MTKLHKKVVPIENGANQPPIQRTRFISRPVTKPIDYTAFARKIEARFPVMMAELAK